MKAAWLCSLVLPVLYAFGCAPAGSAADDDDNNFESSSSTLSAQALAKSTTYLDTQAAAWVDKDDWGFVQGGRCVMSCHTTAPFMMVRPRLPGATGTSGAALATVRGYVEARVTNWSTVAPLYSWVAPDSRGLESIMNAFALVSADAPSNALSPLAKKALGAMWNEQKSDGSFPWWTTFTLAPWENGQSGLWGAALADLTIGLTPPSYVAGMTTAEKAKLASLESYLRTHASAQPSGSTSSASTLAPLHNRAMILLAASKRPTLLTQAVKTEISDAIKDLQSTDGSWNAKSLGFAVAGGTTAENAAHAYATGFYTHVLAQNGDTSSAVTDGRAWLEAHQRSDGAWEAKSLNAPTDAFQNQLITDGATAYAVMALTQ